MSLLLAALGHGLPGVVLTGLLVLLMGWQWWYSGVHERRRAAATA